MRSNKTKPIVFTLLSCLLVSVVLAGCTSSKNQTEPTQQGQGANNAGPKYGGVAKISTNVEITDLGYPAEQRIQGNNTITYPALETLGRFDAEGKITPWLAESWEASPADKKITIKLRQGIKFHDGSDFNAEAAKWNIEQYMNAKRPEVAGIKTVEAVDANTIKLDFDTWNNVTMDELMWAVQMASPTAFKEHGKEWMYANPVGTGPFKFKSWEKNVAIKYVKNENYWKKGLPYLDGIEWRIFTQPMTAKNAFMTKDLDVLLYMTPDIVDQFKNLTAEYDIVNPKSIFGTISNGIIGDSANPKSPFANVKVRQALAYAINKKEIAETIYRGMVIPTNQFSAPGNWAYNPDVNPFDYNPEKAKQLLAEAGYPNGFKTKLSGMQQHSAMMQAVQSYLGKVGIEVSITVVDFAKWQAMAGPDKWEGLMMWTFVPVPDISSPIYNLVGPNSAIYGPNIVRPEQVQKTAAEGLAAPDFAGRQKKAQELEKMVFEEYALATPIIINTTPYLKQKWVQDDGFYMTRGNIFTPEAMWLKK
jgi:peptide/nickel transport system substrate-binding protein